MALPLPSPATAAWRIQLSNDLRLFCRVPIAEGVAPGHRLDPRPGGEA